MFKKAKVLHYVNSLNKKSEIIFKEKLDKYVKLGNFNVLPNEVLENNILLNNLSDYIYPGVILAQNITGIDKFIFICFPQNTTHFSLPIKEGELIWYFKYDESVNYNKNIEQFPLASLNYYWVSRVAGTKFSEDVNYSIKNNDLLVTSNEQFKLINDIRQEKIKIKDLKEQKEFNNIIKNSILFEDYTNESVELYNIPNYNSQLIKDSIENNHDIDAIPRYFSKSYELSLQGSNNSLINLTKDEDNGKGLIDIVSGRHSLREFRDKIKKEEIFIIENLKPLNLSEIYNDFFVLEEFNYIDKNIGVLKYFDKHGNNKVLKNPIYYFANDFNIDNIIEEDEISYTYDASRIMVAEMFDIDEQFYDCKSLNNLFKFDSNYNKWQINLDEIILDKITDGNKLLNGKTIKIQEDENLIQNSMPCIGIKSNNIRIVARKSLFTKENELSDIIENKLLENGTIRFIKEDNDEKNESFISLEKEGQIFIDSKNVNIGSFEKYIKEIGIDINEKEKIKELHGSGKGVILGYHEEYSEPLVLGNSLIKLLNDLIESNLSLIELNKKIVTEIRIHKHSTPNGPTLPSFDFVELNNFESGLFNAEYVLKDIKNNLKYSLSKFSKTS